MKPIRGDLRSSSSGEKGQKGPSLGGCILTKNTLIFSVFFAFDCSAVLQAGEHSIFGQVKALQRQWCPLFLC